MKMNIADMTIKESVEKAEISMSFKEKIEVAKQLEKLKVDVIEMPNPNTDKAEALLIKSLAPMIKNSTISVAGGMTKEEVKVAWDVISLAKHPRIHISFPTSPIQMEFVCGKKPKKLLEEIGELISYAKTLCAEVEFSAIDATRSEKDFLASVVMKAIESGATTIDLCDTAGIMLPDEFQTFLKDLFEEVPSIKSVEISVTCSDELRMANANAFMAAGLGVSQIKTTLVGNSAPMLETVVHMLSLRGDSYRLSSDVKTTELQRAIRQMTWLGKNKRLGGSPFDETIGTQEHEEITLDAETDISTLIKAVKGLGYELTDDDNAKVYKEFKRVAEKKKVGTKELEALIATAALQVPPTYQLVDFVINSGNIITSTAQVTLDKKGTHLKGLSSGDGPIAAAFLAIEMIIGHHYELDDFQIQAVTEGSEAVGSALVKLRTQGKLFSGNGVSTDIIGASIRAYVNALNKIAYEENSNAQ